MINKQRVDKNRRIYDKDQLPRFSAGDFVLLKKLKENASRNLAKARPLYHRQVFRIIKRTQCNAFLVPFTKRFMQERLKNEGKITKNMKALKFKTSQEYLASFRLNLVPKYAFTIGQN